MPIRDFNLKKFQKISVDQLRYQMLNLNSVILGIWIFLNIGIPFITIFYYFWQFEFYHPIFWIFIPDSYSSAILFGMFLIITLGLKRDIQALNIVTFVFLVKAWFNYIIVFISEPSFFEIVSLSAHTFELLEAFLILPFLKADDKSFLISTLMLTLDWFFDFFNPFGLPTIGLYPYHPEFNPNNMAPHIDVFIVGLTIITFGLILMIYLKFRNINKNANHNTKREGQTS
ncbi:MAG: DUF1405 domain-containing protein [Candidatus Hodarchaeota archaeon]